MITKIDSIPYLLNDAEGTATVTKNDIPYEGRVVIPATVKSSGKEYKVTEILDEAFAGCTGLLSVELGGLVESIGISAFEGCMALASVAFGEALHLVGMNAFKGCVSLVEVVFPPRVLVIGRGAFAGCKSLRNAFLPDMLINIEPSRFDCCTAPQRV